MENRAYTLYCNYVGDEKRFHYCGQSGAFHPTGRILAEAGTQGGETTLYALLIDMEDTTAPPDDFLNYLHHRQPQLYHPRSAGNPPLPPGKMAPPPVPILRETERSGIHGKRSLPDGS